MTEPLLRVQGLVKEFNLKAARGMGRKKRVVQAVSDVSFEVAQGETLGLVGESGSGKTTVGRCVLRLLEPTAGSVSFDGVDLASLSFEELRGVRRRMQIVFQDPYASLDPKMTVGASIAEPLVVQGIAGDHEEKVVSLLELVGLSAGQRQRIGIARAFLKNAPILLLDEPTSALDATTESAVMETIAELMKGRTTLMVTHRLNTAHRFDRIVVLEHGRVVEQGSGAELLARGGVYAKMFEAGHYES